MKVTIFTPTYNRINTLPRLYKSLVAQTCFDFEWLIVDDGSFDGTEDYIKTLGNSPFKIRYFYKKNGGKHTVYNFALNVVQGNYFLCVDSDDYLSPDAVESISALVETIPRGCGIVAYKESKSGNLLSGEIPENIIDTTSSELYLVHGCSGEYTYVYPTVIAKRVPFPVFNGERFITESVVYDRLDKICKLIPLRKPLTVCEYQPDGLTAENNRSMRNNPCGFCLYFMQRIDLMPSLIDRIVIAGKYQCFKIMAKHDHRLAYTGTHHILVFCSFFIGLLFRLYYRLFRRI